MSKETEETLLSNILLIEGPGGFSRSAKTLASGQNVVKGEVLGTITASGKLAVYDPDGVDGTETATCIAIEDMDASAGDKTIVVVDCMAAVDADFLTWENGISAGDKADGIADLFTSLIKVQ